MTAWQRLLSISSITVGTAWDLITHPITSTPNSIIYIEQLQSTVQSSVINSELQDGIILTTINDETISSDVVVIDAVTSLVDNTITVEMT